MEKYRDFFNIDPDYYPQVNDELIKQKPDYWKRFYPHDDFVKLIRDTISVLSRKQMRSIWVEGAYGTGKSHAVLTLKNLLDASEEETREYFKKYPDQLSVDLFNQFQRQKSEKKILTVFRYSSSDIKGDDKLITALQQSIVEALEKNGLSANNTALRESALSWLSKEAEKNYFNALLKERYSELFGGDNADVIINKLKTYNGDDLMQLINKVLNVGEKEHILNLSFDTNRFIAWVKQVIKDNDLKAIVFIWDEFTNYFERNLTELSNFQKIVELDITDPFYLFIVSHRSESLFSDTDKDKKRILDRFISPRCNINLPENMAFRLMGEAMKRNENRSKEWEEYDEDLYKRTENSRELVKNTANISDKELKAVLPIHPYAALLLKYISSAFDSNQRSMFDFIKDKNGDKIKGFQWFIDNVGPFDANPLFTVDMLWDFFYEKGKESLTHDVRSILDYYNSAEKSSLEDDEKRVLKTVLLLQAISLHVGDSVDLFIPNETNLNNAFEGTNMRNNRAVQLADKLCDKRILYNKTIGRGEKRYAVLSNAADYSEINGLIDKYKKKSTSALIEQGELKGTLPLEGALSLRYRVDFVSHSDLEKRAKNMRSQVEDIPWEIGAIVALAKDYAEKAAIAKIIDELMKEKDFKKVVFIDASDSTLGADIDDYAEAMAYSEYYRPKDRSVADTYQKNANGVLKKWAKRIESGSFRIRYDDETEKGADIHAGSSSEVCSILKEIDRKFFKYALETGPSVSDNMWASKNLKLGVECAVTGKLSGTFKSGSKQMDLGNFIGEGVWGKPLEFKYWEEKPACLISKIKLKVLSVIDEGFAKNGRVAISDIYNALTEAPFGFLPCNLSAFVVGFLLREYPDSNYRYSDDLAMNGELKLKELKEMIDEVIKKQLIPSIRYRNKYIVKLTEEERAFNEASSKVFSIPLEHCVNTERTRDLIRNQMKKHYFPFWCLKYALNDAVTSSIKSAKADVENLIDLYSGIANDGNRQGDMNAHDMAMEVGKLCLKHPDLANDLASISTVQVRYEDGMKAYCKEFDNGALVKLAEEIDDKGQYINVLKDKFSSTEAAKWLWNQETANEIIKDVILEYRIIAASNEVNVNNRTKSFDECRKGWLSRSKYIRVSYEAAENYLEEGKEFLKMLHDMKKTGIILNKQKFYDLLIADMPAIRNFFDGQIGLFKEVGAFYINNNSFTDNDVKEIYEKLPTDCWTMSKSQYINLVKDACEEFNANSAKAKLRRLWRERTGTETPREWSDKHKMPILCMIDDKDFLDAKDAFDLLGQKNQDINSVNSAISFLESAAFYDKLNSEKERDNAFREKIIKNYGVLLTDISEVKNYLSKNMGADPYDWIALHEKIDGKLREMATAKYDEGGCDKALEKIDSMNADAVKNYLKDLVRRDVFVGMKIMKEN